MFVYHGEQGGIVGEGIHSSGIYPLAAEGVKGFCAREGEGAIELSFLLMEVQGAKGSIPADGTRGSKSVADGPGVGYRELINEGAECRPVRMWKGWPGAPQVLHVSALPSLSSVFSGFFQSVYRVVLCG